MARTTPVNSGYTIINGTTTGSNGNRVDTWVEYKVNGNQLHVLLYAQANWNSGTSSGSTKKNYGYIQINNGDKHYYNTSYNFGYDSGTTTPHINKFGDYTYTIPEGVTSVQIYAYYKTDSTYIDTGKIAITTIEVYQAIARIYVNNAWRTAIPYVFTNGAWRIATPYVYSNGAWKVGT